MSAKRKRAQNGVSNEVTPRKRSRHTEDVALEDDEAYGTPTKSTRKRASLNDDREAQLNETPSKLLKTSTPKSARRVLFSSATKDYEKDSDNDDTNPIVRNADRSARRKSARRLIERTIAGDQSDDEQEEDEIAAEILLQEGEDVSEEESEGEDVPPPETPSKRGRGRPRLTDAQRANRAAKKRKRSITPPQQLPPNELYFWQNRPAATKTSNNSLASQKLLNHEEYFKTISSYRDRHKPEKEFLHEFHCAAFGEWAFELSEGFNICLYGYGSKQQLTEAFAAYLHRMIPSKESPRPPKILIINGFNPGITMKEILQSIATNLLPYDTKRAPKIPSQVAPLLSYIFSTLSSDTTNTRYYIIINSIDAPSIRRTPNPSILASIAASPRISLVATADNPNFPLLWDTSLLSQYRFIFHDSTTFESYDQEMDIVDSVNTLLGRTGRRIQGKDGVNWVLRSLPQNARSLFMILISEQLAMIDEGVLAPDQNGPFMEFAPLSELQNTPSKRGRKPLVKQVQQKAIVPPAGVEYRVLYHKAVEAFICTSEVAFRTLLKEFHDHQMIESRKDALGTERLVVPFRREELEGLVEELAAEETGM